MCLKILVDVIHELINTSGSLGLTWGLIHLLFACLAQFSFPVLSSCLLTLLSFLISLQILLITDLSITNTILSW